MNLKLTTDERILQDTWLIRPCQVYQDEYSSCRSIKARLHQQFIHGASLDCSPWKRDYDNCLKWESNKNLKAAEELCTSERERRIVRLRGHVHNDVWERRKAPPEDWNKPLPDEILKEYEGTFLNLKAKEIRGEPIPDIASDLRSKCTIM